MNGSTETSTQGTPTPSLRRTELGLPDMSGSFATSLVSLQFQMRVRVDAAKKKVSRGSRHLRLYGPLRKTIATLAVLQWQPFEGYFQG